MDLSINLGSLKLRNPIIAASGCFGYGVEYAEAVDLSTLGGVAVKGLFLNERWYRARIRPGSFDAKDPVASLDCSLCQDQILAPIFDLNEVKKATVFSAPISKK